MSQNQKNMTSLEIAAMINRFKKLTPENRWNTIKLMSVFSKRMEAEESIQNGDEDKNDLSDMTAAEVEEIVDRMKNMTSENRRGLIDLLNRFCDLMDAENQ